MVKFHLNKNEPAGLTKVQQVVHSIAKAIDTGQLKMGDVLPSVNQLSGESGFSRDTIFKAYNILKQRSLVESAPAKGYFVAGESFRIFMLLDDFSAFKEQLYQTFRQNLPPSYAVDLLFHHYNPEVFHQLIQNSLGRYSVYIVMNIDHGGLNPLLNKIDFNKLLVLDMGKPENTNINFIVQDFNESVKNCLEKGKHLLQKYKQMIVVYEKNSTPHPSETVGAARSFCRNHSIRFRKIEKVEESQMEKGQVYFVFRDSDLVKVVKNCRNHHFETGSDIGILSYNDTPMKEIVGNGISVISTDFEMMGKLAADFVKNRQSIRKILPTFLTLRNSL